MTQPRICLLVGALLLFCTSFSWCASKEKCTAIEDNPTSNTSYDFVPHILKALAIYRPCEHGDPKCLCHAATIQKNLEPYVDKGITPEMMAQSKRLGTLYQIIRGRIYRQQNCLHTKRCADVEDLLLDVASDVPDLEFVLNVRDWPQVHFLSGLSGPVFSYSITARHLDIMYPAWSFWTTTGPNLQHYPHGVGRWDWMRKHLAARASEMPWHAKRPIGFFRGSRSSPERDSLVRLSHRRPDLVDAQYTLLATDADPAEKMPLDEHCRFKYLFNFRGVAASFRLRHILLCRSLVLHVGDQWQEFFYSQLKPWVHYVPVASDADVEQLAELILYLREHDDLAEEIAERGQQFVWLHLRMEDVQCYWRKVLQEYGKLLTYKVQREPGLLEVSNKKAVQLYRGK